MLLFNLTCLQASTTPVSQAACSRQCQMYWSHGYLIQIRKGCRISSANTQTDIWDWAHNCLCYLNIFTHLMLFFANWDGIIYLMSARRFPLGRQHSLQYMGLRDHDARSAAWSIRLGVIFLSSFLSSWG
eukprot:2252186-Amphidinium_carterae.1